jgi:hypothetical protein
MRVRFIDPRLQDSCGRRGCSPQGFGLLCELFGWCPAAPANLLLSVLLAAAGALGYWLTLEPLGRLLQRREQRILHVVTQEVE